MRTSVYLAIAGLIFFLPLSATVAQDEKALEDSAMTKVVDTQNLEEELKSLKESMLAAYEGNVEGLREHLHPEVVVTWQDATVSKGPDGVIQYLKKKLEGPNRVVAEVRGNPKVEERRIFDTHIVSFGNMNDTFTLMGKETIMGEESAPIEFNSRFSSIVIRHEGKLKLAGMHMSVNAFNNPVTDYAAQVFKKIAIFAGLATLIVGFLLGRVTGKKRA